MNRDLSPRLCLSNTMRYPTHREPLHESPPLPPRPSAPMVIQGTDAGSAIGCRYVHNRSVVIIVLSVEDEESAVIIPNTSIGDLGLSCAINPIPAGLLLGI
eukprot:TRINITY_DN83400_c0_g1_i1.p3 TRINITY_DN83400_c0_g1~~TRINITY_DN83400_c0_g1_i1.p3  ORF type:complete len:101 (+),score=1.09 TRINITY_DN83400_c0_g1_i1:46-348(+)